MTDATSDLAGLIDSLPALVWAVLPDGRPAFIGKNWRQYTGSLPGLEGGNGWDVVVHPEDLAGLLSSWAAIEHTSEPKEVRARIRRYDGVYRWFSFRARPGTVDPGKPIKFCGIGIDIDDELKIRATPVGRHDLNAGKEASDAALRQAYTHFTVAQRVSATGSFISALADDEHVWSDELYRILELDPAVVPRVQLVRDIVHPDDRAIYDDAIQRGLSGSDVDFEFRIVTPRGAVKHLRAAARLSDYVGGHPMFMGAIQDVTESKVAQENLKSSEAELRRAYESFSDAQRLSKTGSFTTDLLVDDHHWSEESYRIFDFDPDSTITVHRVRDIVHPDDQALFDSMIQRGAGGIDVDFEFRIVTHRGCTKHIRAFAHVVERVAGRPMFVGALQDITESKIADEALTQTRAELARVARATALSALTASIAHEINQPLAGIVTNANTCLRMLDAQSPNLEGAKVTAERTIRDATRASDVIKRLRGLFSNKKSTSEPFDLTEATRELLSLTSNELQHRRIALRTNYTDDHLTVLGDRVQIQQVVLNLVLNAADAMKDIEDRPRDLLIETAFDEMTYAKLSVQDCGIGFDIQDIDRLFDAFYTTKTEGMGIGLSISRSIVEKHGGRLWASRNDGPGATFSFSIPTHSVSMQA